MGVLLEKLTLLIGPKQIAAKIHLIAQEIDRDYHDKNLMILMVLKGAVCLAADLIRAIKVPCDLETVQCKSYGEKGIHRGPLEVIGLDAISFAGKDVLIVDDIFDSGHTLNTLVHKIQEKNPRSIRSLVMLNKKIERPIQIHPDYVMFDIEDHFVVGFGLDYKEFYRGLDGIYLYEETK